MRVHNFNPGPAALPLSVLQKVQAELIDFQGSGMSILEHSHRGKAYERVHDDALALVHELLQVPATHDVLFMQGGAHTQFSLVPLNFLHAGKSADYLITGGWSERALDEARTLGAAREACNTKHDGTFTRIPRTDEITLDADAVYAHMTTNNTLYGTQWQHFPDTGRVPLVADMASDLMWRPFDVGRFALIYGCAQKNLGPSGVTVVIIRKDFITSSRAQVPKSLRYDSYAAAKSLYNTPPTFSIYVMKEVLAWTKAQGGVAEMERRNREKASCLYGVIDALPNFYRCPVASDSRSVMNAVFRLPNEGLEDRFVAEAAEEEIVGIKGHRSVGGMRVSMYNAVSIESVHVLAEFMKDFAAKNAA